MALLSKFKKNWKLFADEYGGSWIYWNSLYTQRQLFNLYYHLLSKYLKKTDRVLDVGAGRLFYKPLIKSFTPHYKSIDFCRTHPKIDYIGSASDTKQPDRSYDFIFCVQVLEHVPDPDESFQEFYRVLKKNGRAVIAVPFLMYLHNEPYDFYRYTKHKLIQFAENNNFVIEYFEEVGGLFGFLGAVNAMLLIGGTWKIPLIKWIAYVINLFIQLLCYIIDKLTNNKSVFPANYVVVLRKM